jgi:hypothetical protein
MIFCKIRTSFAKNITQTSKKIATIYMSADSANTKTYKKSGINKSANAFGIKRQINSF